MDEAASRLRMQIDSKPEELDELDRRVIQLKIEREALKKEFDKASKDRLQALDVELGDLEEKADSLTARWLEEKKSVQNVQGLKEKLDAARQELDGRATARKPAARRRARLWRDPGSRKEAEKRSKRIRAPNSSMKR